MTDGLSSPHSGNKNQVHTGYYKRIKRCPVTRNDEDDAHIKVMDIARDRTRGETLVNAHPIPFSYELTQMGMTSLAYPLDYFTEHFAQITDPKELEKCRLEECNFEQYPSDF